MPSTVTARYWFVIPAAGIGARMNTNIPKQYLLLNHKTILEHTLERVLGMPQLAGIVVAVSPQDSHWHTLAISQHPLVHTVVGGAERADSVLSALDYLQQKASAQDWVLVHDAARPCVTLGSIARLCEQLANNDVGGILAVPVSDTLKQVDANQAILATIDRRPLWQAQTPQMFRYQLLRDCLVQALASQQLVTDEASALELCGYTPSVIQGRSDNLKITRPDDLLLAEFILAQQANTQEETAS